MAAAALFAAAAVAGSGFRFPFSSSPTPTPGASPSSQPSPARAAYEAPRVRNDNPSTTAAAFDPEALERGLKVLREINKHPDAKKMFAYGGGDAANGVHYTEG